MGTHELDDRQLALLEAIATTKTSENARKRFYLFQAQKGLCFWCGMPMTIHYLDGGKTPDDAATIEHLDSRLSPERGRHAQTRRLVAAHASCNHDYARACEKAVGIDELRRRASHEGRPL